MISSDAAVAVRGVTKRFGEQRALDGVDLTVVAGSIHGLLGENGCGKSTLIKVLAGAHAADEGTIRVRGRDIDMPLTAATSADIGFRFVHQDLGLIASLSVAENLQLEDIARARTGPRVSDRSLRARARTVLDRYDLAVDPAVTVSELRPVERALLAIVRAVEGMPEGTGGLLVLDEPTVFLPRADVQHLFALIRRLAAHGHAVMLVSHDLDEVLDVCDTVTVLRDGRLVSTSPTEGLTRGDLVEMIVGRSVDFGARVVPKSATAPIALTVRGLSGGTLRGFNLAVAEGEIVGLTGLAGAGFDEVPYLVTGARRASGGAIALRDGPTLDAASMTPRRARSLGVGLLPADRRNTAGIAALDVVDNVTMLTLSAYRRWFGLDRAAMRRATMELMEAFDVRPRDPHHAFGTLSGGNQQKALLAKWLTMSPRVLIIDEPTQGVDIGARKQIFDDLHRAASEGAAVLITSTDHEQLAILCDRVVVVAQGRFQAELHGARLTKSSISEACMTGDIEPGSTALGGAA